MVSKHTKILFLVAVATIGSTFVWQNYSQMLYERSHHSPASYNLELHNGVGHVNGPDVHVPLLRSILRVVGTFALLLAIPLLVNDIVHRQKHRAT